VVGPGVHDFRPAALGLHYLREAFCLGLEGLVVFPWGLRRLPGGWVSLL
jgi:hypothetical protein